MLEADVHTELSPRLYALFFHLGCEWIWPLRLSFKQNFFSGFIRHPPLFRWRNKREISDASIPQNGETRENCREQKDTNFLDELLLFCLFFFANQWLYCLYLESCNDNPNVGVLYFTKGHSVKVESPFSFEVIISIEFTPYFLRKHLGHCEDNRSFTGFNDLNDLPINDLLMI